MLSFTQNNLCIKQQHVNNATNAGYYIMFYLVEKKTFTGNGNHCEIHKKNVVFHQLSTSNN
jgi:hypothetical protein